MPTPGLVAEICAWKKIMKRTSLFAVMLLVAINSFAYYGDYGYGRSETSPADVLLFIILFVFGILQIILFFKIWGMTNNIKKIRKHIIGDFEEITDYNYRRLAYSGDTRELKDRMIYYFINAVRKAYNNLPIDRSVVENGHYKRLETNRSIAQYKEVLRRQLETIGEPLPEMIDKVETFDDYMKSYNDINFLKEYEELSNKNNLNNIGEK